jgi:hypothetical protein
VVKWFACLVAVFQVCEHRVVLSSPTLMIAAPNTEAPPVAWPA